MNKFWFIAALFLSNLLIAQAPLSYRLENSAWEYSVITPPGKAKGLIVFIPGFTQTAKGLLSEIEFHNIAYLYGLSTVIIPCGSKLYADGDVVKDLNDAITRVMSDHEIPKNKVILGGFSIGGSIALRYAEYCLKYKQDYPLQPAGVFIVDSPVELQDLYKYCEREIGRNYSQEGVEEAKFVKNIFDREIGSPETESENFEAYSPFNLNKPYGGNIRLLQSTPVRSYHDADVLWQLANRRRGFLGMNVTMSSEMISSLMIAGNRNAELILANGQGVQSNGERQPHSMSIVNEQELMIWMLKNLQIPVNAALQKNFENNQR